MTGAALALSARSITFVGCVPTFALLPLVLQATGVPAGVLGPVEVDATAAWARWANVSVISCSAIALNMAIMLLGAGRPGGGVMPAIVALMRLYKHGNVAALTTMRNSWQLFN
jgi:hypothetical protein